MAEFGPDGAWLRDYVLPASLGAMSVPHSLVLHECRRQLLVADREGGAVHAFQMGQGRHLGERRAASAACLHAPSQAAAW